MLSPGPLFEFRGNTGVTAGAGTPSSAFILPFEAGHTSIP
jgi:hypothetical protein